MVVGRVVRFDGMRGYGFIAPDRGGEDVFLHVNDLLIPESSLRSGLAVEFEVEDGERGPKASGVRFAPEAVTVPAGAGAVAGAGAARTAVAPAGPVAPVASESVPPPLTDGQEALCDVLSGPEYTGEVTELLLSCGPELTGQQIVAVRRHLLLFAKRHGWVED